MFPRCIELTESYDPFFTLQVVKMVVVVVLVFVLCCSPIQLLMASAIFNTDEQVKEIVIIIISDTNEIKPQHKVTSAPRSDRHLAR